MPKTLRISVLESTEPVRKNRLFEAGQMKLLTLYFIAQSPKYSYDIIKAIADVVGGGYMPSTGTIYPTLKYLEQQQYVMITYLNTDRKQYQVTQKGDDYLQTQQDKIEQILCRFDTRKQIQNNEQYLDIKRAMENLKASLRLKIQYCELSPEQVREIANKIDQAAVDISRLED